MIVIASVDCPRCLYLILLRETKQLWIGVIKHLKKWFAEKLNADFFLTTNAADQPK